MKRKLSTLLMLVIFVFFVLLASIMISALIAIFMVRAGALPQAHTDRFALPLISLQFILLASFVTSTILSAFVGKRFLRPLRSLIEATKEIASGNFNIRVDSGRAKEIEQLTRSFNDMARELEGLEMLRSDFVSSISHEFKTPTASIKGFAQRLKKNDLSIEQRREYVDIIIAESNRLTELSGNILLLSNLESTEKITDKTVYYLDEQLRRILLVLEPLLLKKHIKTDISLIPVQVAKNEDILYHLWINLLGNAIKFTPDGGRVGISLNSDGKNVTVSITDTGIGIDAEVQKRIFEKFYQADKSRATEGNGLGLSLAKRITQLENGEITVESRPGEGTCFTVTLPVGDTEF